MKTSFDPSTTLPDVCKSLLEAQPMIKAYHWQTKNYHKHIVSGDLYTDFAKKVDKFVEIFLVTKITNTSNKNASEQVNTNTKIKTGKKNNSMDDLDSQFIEFLDNIINYLYSKSENWSPPILSLRDDIINKISRSKYLLEKV